MVPVARWRGVGPEYEYLRPSIQHFPTGPEQEELALVTGFAKVRPRAAAARACGGVAGPWAGRHAARLPGICSKQVQKTVCWPQAVHYEIGFGLMGVLVATA